MMNHAELHFLAVDPDDFLNFVITTVHDVELLKLSVVGLSMHLFC